MYFGWAFVVGGGRCVVVVVVVVVVVAVDPESSESKVGENVRPA